MAVGLTACAQGMPEGVTESATATATATAKPTPSVSLANGTSQGFGVSVSGPMGSRPTVLVGDETEKATAITLFDVVQGKGAAATATDKVVVEYVAKAARSKRRFDSSWDRGQAFDIDLTKITFAAFVRGIPGMKVGGRRIVVVPGPMAFGTNPPAGSRLNPDETVVYVIDLLSLDK